MQAGSFFQNVNLLKTMSDQNHEKSFPSEASRMLEAALEQMDGIIQGAKYELPNYFDSFSIQVI